MKKQTANKTEQTEGRFSACLLSETTGQPKLPRKCWDSESCREALIAEALKLCNGKLRHCQCNAVKLFQSVKPFADFITGARIIALRHIYILQAISEFVNPIFYVKIIRFALPCKNMK